MKTLIAIIAVLFLALIIGLAIRFVLKQEEKRENLRHQLQVDIDRDKFLKSLDELKGGSND